MLHLTPAMLESAYELLRTTPPFNKWKLPESDAVEFHVKTLSGCVAKYNMLSGDTKHRISLCAESSSSLLDVLEHMAHEMVHLHQRAHSVRSISQSATHGYHFKRLAAQVCRRLAFDPATF